MAQNDKDQLVAFLDRKAFDPVLRASPNDYNSQSEKDKLEDVQQSTRSEKDRYHNSYKSAKEVHDRFRDDLTSEAAKKIDRELKELHLPTLEDVKEEFEQMCHRMACLRRPATA